MLDDVAILARTAGREIYRIWKEGFSVNTKRDGSIVTIADQHAEAIILAGLVHIAPDVPVIAEEQVAAGRIPRVGSRFFLVDPLDGTKGFAEGGKDEFTVNIGLIEDGRPVLGVVYAPASGALWAGGPAGAWATHCDPQSGEERKQRTPLSVSSRTEGWRLIGSSTFSGPRLKAFAAATGAASTVTASSSLKFCRVASGEADIYPRFGPLSEWDVAAGHAVLVAAGGDVMTLSGEPIPYGRRPGQFELDGLVAFGNAAAETAARAALGAAV
ncbi:MAG: 3'(2'),5'-bisphosphate nucleotidase CysQ [Hyphomonadaceae bacterium]|nr:3'(2'),5'-bisphosphate nucleotidase CysQ [Hyphomonadaceae bacterium]